MKRENVVIRKNCKTDRPARFCVIPKRRIKVKKFVIGDNALIRSNTVIYAGTKIGNGLQTGHNVIIGEQNLIDDNLQIWSDSVY